MNNEEMEQINEAAPETPAAETSGAETPDDTGAVAADTPVYRQKPFIMAMSILGVVLVAVAGLLVWRYAISSSGTGRPVPAPRSVSFDKTGDGGENAGLLPAGGQKITLTPEQLAAADLKIVAVGEKMSSSTRAATTTGVVRANEYRETPVLSLVGGVARQVYAELGQFVRAGQPVAVVYSDELAAAQAKYLARRAELEEARRRFARAGQLTEIASESRDEIDQARAAVKIARAKLVEEKSEYERTEKLVRIGAASREAFEQAATDLRTAEAKLTEAENRLARAERLLEINPARRAEQDSARKQLETARAELAAEREKLLVLGLSPQRVNTLVSTDRISAALPIVSPVSGTVTARKVDSGEVVSANSEIFTVTNLATVWVIAQVYEKDLADLRIGSGASITTDAYPGVIFRGNVSYIDPNLDETTRTARVRIELLNAGEKLKIGMYVNVAFATLPGGAENTVPAVPEEAVQEINGQKVVFVATREPNVFILRPVRVGVKRNGLIPVTEGLFVGDRVVSAGSFLLRAEWLKTNPAGI